VSASLPPAATIGIVGGGQLGRMSAMAAARLGYRCHIYAPEPDGPASQVSARTTLGAYDDLDALSRFGRSVDVVTFEFENVSAAGLDALAGVVPVHPAPAILRTSQDRVVEKTFFESAGAHVGAWMAIEDRAALDAAVARLGLPSVLKTTRLGYDGRGQAVLRTPEDLDAAWSRLAPKPLILEKFVDFACELSVIVARNTAGDIAAFDAVENRHRHHILDLTLAPAQVIPEIADAAKTLAIQIAEKLDLVGLLAIEMFVDRDGTLLVNEMAPRPHNSGHWTIDACPCSQFELHIRAVAGLPLPPATRHSDAVMKNLVGPDELELWPHILKTPGLIPHHYGKVEARPGRKMGHVTTLFPKGSLPGAFGIEAALGVLGKG
jgi:5-(carboxyamino)imidazole ribonucleotide synthase